MDLTYILLFLTAVFGGLYWYYHRIVLSGINSVGDTVTAAHLPSLSVIVAARNEERVIERCIKSLLDQNYPKDAYEIIIVNDRSTDSTASLIEPFTKTYPILKLITINGIISDLPPKKNALHEGISASKNEFLVFTDADCIVQPNWLRSIVSCYTPGVGAVAGYSPFLFPAAYRLIQHIAQRFLHYEELKNTLGAIAGVQSGNAYMCTGRNFSYRKSIFKEIGGFDSIKQSLSGDDDLFLQQIQKQTHWQIRYLIRPDSYVLTEPPCTFRQFLNQRKRHFSAGSYYPKNIQFAFFSIHSFNLLSILLFLAVPVWGIPVLIVKLIIDRTVTLRGGKLVKLRFTFMEFLLCELLFVLYNLIVGPLGVIGTFDWKGSKQI